MFTQTKRACSLLKMIEIRWPVSVPIRLVCKTGFTEVVEAFQKWVCTLHFWLYLSQFLTDFQNSFFLWKLMKSAIWFKSGCTIAQPAHPLPLPLFFVERTATYLSVTPYFVTVNDDQTKNYLRKLLIIWQEFLL